MSKQKKITLKRILMTLETTALAAVVVAGTVPLELGAAGIVIGSGGKAELVLAILLPFALQVIINVTKMFLLSHLLHQLWPQGILKKLISMATKVKSFEGLYDKSLRAVKRKDFMLGNSLLFVLGLLPLPTTQIGVLVASSTRYHAGIIPLMLGSGVKIALAAIGSFYGILWLQQIFNPFQ